MTGENRVVAHLMPEDEARVKALEEKVNGLRAAVDQVLSLLQADPVAASFRRFQQDADRQMGRG